MPPRIETLKEKKLVGKRMVMSFSDNTTGDLWRSFMPRRKEIRNKLSTDLYSLQIYGPGYFRKFDPTEKFEKWALVEVSDFEAIPADMETFTLKAGLYAVFVHIGDEAAFYETAQYIHGVWLPDAQFELDDRPHFELLGAKYKNGAPNSEEEIWLPIRPIALGGGA